MSVAEIKYKEEQKAIQISARFFLDDIELALRAYTGDENLDIGDEANWPLVNMKLGEYLNEKISLKSGKNKDYALNYVGSEIEKYAVWCYLEVDNVKRFDKLIVKNTALQEVLSDQENLVHVRAFNKVKSARLFKGDASKVFSWD